MNPTVYYEIIGYIASLLVAISLMMSSIIKLRIINLMGAATFALYGFLIGSMPVALVNAFISGVNIYYLHSIFAAKDYFKIMESGPASEYLKNFLIFYEKDIQQFNPGFTYDPSANQQIYFVMRNLVPVGLLIIERKQGGEAEILLDYVIPGYRDFKPGRFVYHDRKDIFRRDGLEKFITKAHTERQKRYLQKMGFKKVSQEGEVEWYSYSISERCSN